jgi:protein-disulfide isomerase
MPGVSSTNGLRFAHAIALTFICLSATPVFPSSTSGTNDRAASIDGSGKNGGTPFQRGASNAPVTIVEFSDFQCPFSGAAQSILSDLLREHPGNIRLVFKNSPLPIHPDAVLAHEAALAAGEQGKFWEMHDLIFAHQSQLAMTDLVAYAKQLSLKLAVFEDRLASHYYKTFIDNDLAEARRLGVDATPTFFVNDRKIVGLSGLRAAVAAAFGDPHPTINAIDMLQPAKLNIEYAPVRGAIDAPVTIVEFSDLQCPYCSQALPIINGILKDHPNQVRLVFKHFPLAFHPDSLLAHQAALAAGEQGKFWEMHDLIFTHQNNLKRDELIHMAQSLGLDMKRFVAELDSERSRSKIIADQNEGMHLGVSATPTFYVNGKELIGVGSQSEFTAVINQALRAAGAYQTFNTNKSELGRDEYSRGPVTAPVKILWFTDVQSALAPKAGQMLKQIMNRYPGKIRLILRHCPLEIHPDALLAHEVIIAAGKQGKFWEMHESLLAHQSALKKENLIAYAKALGLDSQKIADDLQRETYRPAVEADLSEARERDVHGTPVFFVNGHRVDGVQSFESFNTVVIEYLAGQSPQGR